MTKLRVRIPACVKRGVMLSPGAIFTVHERYLQTGFLKIAVWCVASSCRLGVLSFSARGNKKTTVLIKVTVIVLVAVTIHMVEVEVEAT